MDAATGFYNQKGFTAERERWLSAGRRAVALFYFSLEGFDQAARLMGPAQEAAFLRSIPQRLDGYIRCSFLAGRLGAGNFILTVRETMSQRQREDFAKGLSLELLRVRTNGEKSSLMARYQCAQSRPGAGRAEEEIAALLHAYYGKITRESPARMLTEKCNQLIEGNNTVIFDEYTVGEMTELSKALNRYRKRGEQLLCRDPVFHVGNRPKYFRDTEVLISYDAKRRFSRFCVDICALSQYDGLFSTDVGTPFCTRCCGASPGPSAPTSTASTATSFRASPCPAKIPRPWQPGCTGCSPAPSPWATPPFRCRSAWRPASTRPTAPRLGPCWTICSPPSAFPRSPAGTSSPTVTR
ncbi:diguanylate cyclase domain-containing protein [uncultured Oscillibacter sp.]|uniref:diguanylate cyclase domain-containing protein n=1 Tax=uncultured Oscillibacter sp. TaxID=876091 RepID=UPI0028039EB0|nr:diguanylate cyclase [uncultured Oscillibacter sp.]